MPLVGRVLQVAKDWWSTPCSLKNISDSIIHYTFPCSLEPDPFPICSWAWLQIYCVSNYNWLVWDIWMPHHNCGDSYISKKIIYRNRLYIKTDYISKQFIYQNRLCIKADYISKQILYQTWLLIIYQNRFYIKTDSVLKQIIYQKRFFINKYYWLYIKHILYLKCWL